MFFNPIKRTTAFVILLLLVANVATNAQTSNLAGVGSGSQDLGLSPREEEGLRSPLVGLNDLNPYNISIPFGSGQIEEVFQGDPNQPLVVHIQNVHSNYEAQIHIKKILHHLSEHHDFSLIQTEGAEGKLNPAVLRFTDVPQANVQMADFLMKEGRITGADAFAIEAGKNVQFYGIEDGTLYLENLATFKKVFGRQSEIHLFFAGVNRLIDQVSRKLFDSDALDFTRKKKAYSLGRVDLLDYLSYLNEMAAKKGLVSLSDLSNIKDYPNLTRILRLKQLEASIMQESLQKETAEFKKAFAHLAPNDEADALVARLGNAETGERPRMYFRKLTRFANQAKIDFVAYPQLQLFAEYLIYQDEIDHRQLFEELKRYEMNLQNVVFDDQEEKAFVAMIEFSNLLEEYFELGMSRERISEYLMHQDQIKPSWIGARLLKLAEIYKINPPALGSLDMMDSYMADLEYFYRLVLKRDEIFVSNILERMKSLGQNKTILLTGGFHKDGLIDYFRKEKISYLVINPKVDVLQGNENYIKVMMDEDAVIGSVYAGSFAVEVLNMMNNTLRNDVQNWVLSVNAAAAYAVARGEILAVASDDFIQRMNEHLEQYRMATDSQVVPRIVSAVVRADRFVEVVANVGLYLHGKRTAFQLTAEYDRQTKTFVVRPQEIAVPDEMRRLISEPEVPRSRAVFSNANLPTLPNALIRLGQLPKSTHVPSASDAIILGTTVVSESIEQSVLDFMLHVLRGNPYAVSSLSADDLAQLDGGVVPASIDAQIALQSKPLVFTTDALARAVSENELAGRRLQAVTSQEDKPRIFAVISTPETLRSELRFLAGNLMLNPHSIAFVYGANVTPDLMRNTVTDLAPGVVERTHFVNVTSPEVSAAQIRTDILSGKIYNALVGRISMTIPEMKQAGVLRILHPEGISLGTLPGVNAPRIISGAGQASVRERGDLLKDAVLFHEIRMLRFLPGNEQELAEWQKLLSEMGYDGFMVQVGSDLYQFNGARLQEVLQMYEFALEIARAA